MTERESYRVVLTKGALADFQSIERYVRDRSGDNAARLAQAIWAAIESLEFMPGRGNQVRKGRGRRSTIYVHLVSPYLIYYRTERKPPTVYVMGIRHGSRRQPRRFP